MVCDRLTKNSMYVQKKLKISSQIIRLRYEDFTTDAVGTTQKIYKFIGTSSTQKLLDWVEKATHHSCTGNCSSFTTTRNAAEVAIAWRQWYTLKEVKIVEKFCGRAIDLLGYSAFKNEFDLKDDLK